MQGQRLLAILLGGAATGILAIASLSAHDPITTRVTWNREISRIVQARCVSCHSPGGRGPMSLVSYEDARPWAKAIREEVLTRRMPKWHAARGYGDFSNDPSLSPFEIALIAAWADGGAPKGIDGDTKGGSSAPPVDRDAQTNPPGNDSKMLTVPCGDQAVPAGLLLGIRPRVAAHASVGISAILPDGRREILGYIRDYEPDFATTYWLRVPLELSTGSRIVSELTPTGDSGSCAVDITVRTPQ